MGETTSGVDEGKSSSWSSNSEGRDLKVLIVDKKTLSILLAKSNPLEAPSKRCKDFPCVRRVS